MKFAFCEILNFVNVFGQIFFLNMFFGGVFTHFGVDVFNMSNEDPELRTDPLNEVFPKVNISVFKIRGNFQSDGLNVSKMPDFVLQPLKSGFSTVRLEQVGTHCFSRQAHGATMVCIFFGF